MVQNLYVTVQRIQTHSSVPSVSQPIIAKEAEELKTRLRTEHDSKFKGLDKYFTAFRQLEYILDWSDRAKKEHGLVLEIKSLKDLCAQGDILVHQTPQERLAFFTSQLANVRGLKKDLGHLVEGTPKVSLFVERHNDLNEVETWVLAQIDKISGDVKAPIPVVDEILERDVPSSTNGGEETAKVVKRRESSSEEQIRAEMNANREHSHLSLATSKLADLMETSKMIGDVNFLRGIRAEARAVHAQILAITPKLTRTVSQVPRRL
jgi:hypothetical protein